MRFPKMWYVGGGEPKIQLLICAVWSEHFLVVCIFHEYLATDQQHFECLSLKGSCTDSSEYAHVKMPHCWKPHATAHKTAFRIAIPPNFQALLHCDVKPHKRQ